MRKITRACLCSPPGSGGNRLEQEQNVPEVPEVPDEAAWAQIGRQVDN